MIQRQAREYRVEGREFDGNYLDARIYAQQLASERDEPVPIEQYVYDWGGDGWRPLYYITRLAAPLSPTAAIQKVLPLTAAGV